MAFELRPGGDLREEICRAGCEQLDTAADLLAKGTGRIRSIHEVRKSLKRGRALLRLSRPALDKREFRKLDSHLRDIGGTLSPARDWQAMLEALAGLEMRYGKDWNPGLMGGMRAIFQGRLQRGEFLLENNGARACKQVRKASRRFHRICQGKKQLSLGAGIEQTYTRAQRRFKRAYELGDGAAFHNWRKEAQRHWRQMQLLVAAWPEEMSVRISKARALSQALGDDHDLHVLLGHVRNAGPEQADWSEMESFYDGCIERQLACRIAARNQGKLLFAERPEAFRRRIMRYWRAAGERYSQGMAPVIDPEIEDTVVPFPARTVTPLPADAGEAEPPPTE